MKKGLPLILACILAILAIAGVSAFALWNYTSGPVDSAENAKTVTIDVPQGATVREVSAELYDKGCIKSPAALYLAARLGIFSRPEPFNLKSGFYTLDTSMSLAEICDILNKGEQGHLSVSIPEGLTVSKTAALLEENGVCSGEAFITLCRDKTVLSEYGIPAESFEGYLFPDTYFFLPDMNERDVLDIFLENFAIKIQQIPNTQGLSPEELHDYVILASIVEREYRIADEAPVIASVFRNRLDAGIGLYSCATIEYIITEIQRRPHPEVITYDDLKIDSPYNTYLWAGLPKGPISNPGLVALNAAINPNKTDYYYFVLTDVENGKHTFSENFDQHKAAENTVYYSKG